MANVKITELTALEAQPSSDDYFVIVDVSEAADADKTKKIDFGYAIKTYADTVTTTVFASYPEVVPSARVYNNAAISINHDTITTLTFNTEHWDTDTIHDTSTNPSRLTCNTAGIYHVYGHVRFASNATGQRVINIIHNGSTNYAAHSQATINGANTRMSLSTEISMAVNEYVELQVYQNSTGSLDIEANSAFSPEFGMTFMGKAST